MIGNNSIVQGSGSHRKLKDANLWGSFLGTMWRGITDIKKHTWDLLSPLFTAAELVFCTSLYLPVNVSL